MGSIITALIKIRYTGMPCQPKRWRQKSERKTKSLAEIIFINALLRHGKTDSAFALVEACLLKNPVSDPATRDIYFNLAALKADCFGDASNYKDALSELYRIISEAEQYKDSLVLAKTLALSA